MATTRQPSPLFKMKSVVELYGKATQSEENPAPQSMDELSLDYRVLNQFVWKKTDDKDDIGWAKGRCGFYVNEEGIKDFLMYLDELFHWRKDYEDAEFEQLEGDMEIVVHMQKTSPFKLTLDKKEDGLKCKIDVVEDEDETTMSVFDLPPPTFPARIVVLTFEIVSATKVHCIFSGNTKPFQNNFVKRSIKGKSVKVSTNDMYGEYLRVMEHVNIGDEEACAKMLQDMFEECMEGSPIVVRVKETKFDLEQ